MTSTTVVSTPTTYANGDAKVTLRIPKGYPKLRKGARVDVSDPVTSAVLFVPSGGDLSAALTVAKAGDIIELQAGAIYPPIVLPVHAGDVDITIRTRGVLPSVRVDPVSGAGFATICSTAVSVPPIDTAPGAHHWRLDGVAVTQTGGQTYELIRLGDGEDGDPSRQPHHITLDRLRVFVADDMPQRRGIGVNGNDITITRCDIRNIKEVGADSQAISGRQGERIAILDSYLEAAGENVLFGGADPGITNAVPSDIRIEGNTISKPIAWRGSGWAVKNSLELKNARRVTIRGNVIEHTWAAAQDGYAVVLTPRNQGGAAPWSTVEDVLIEGNLIRDVSSAFNLLGTDDEQPSQTMARVTIRNNVVRASGAQWGGDGRCFLIGAGAHAVTIDHNTCIADGSSAVTFYGSPTVGLVVTNNLFRHNDYGVIGDGTGIGSAALDVYAPDAVFQRNVFGGGEGQSYPASTLLPTMSEFVAHFAGYPANLALVPGSPWIGAGTDGQNLGANLTMVPP